MYLILPSFHTAYHAYKYISILLSTTLGRIGSNGKELRRLQIQLPTKASQEHPSKPISHKQNMYNALMIPIYDKMSFNNSMCTYMLDSIMTNKEFPALGKIQKCSEARFRASATHKEIHPNHFTHKQTIQFPCSHSYSYGNIIQ